MKVALMDENLGLFEGFDSARASWVFDELGGVDDYIEKNLHFKNQQAFSIFPDSILFVFTQLSTRYL